LIASVSVSLAIPAGHHSGSGIVDAARLDDQPFKFN
jgi:hypothetical protein